jgi:hypothetical protein
VYGDTITTTTERVIPTYEFVGTAGDAIAITLSSDDFDTILELYAPNGARLAVNDDIDAENLNSAIQFTLQTDGTYRILVSAFNPPPIGEFTLTLTTQPDAD